jgi:hypothetical protein
MYKCIKTVKSVQHCECWSQVLTFSGRSAHIRALQVMAEVAKVHIFVHSGI